MKNEIFDKWGIVVIIVTWALSAILFRNYSGETNFSIIAAFISAGMAWMAYVTLRMVFFAFRK